MAWHLRKEESGFTIAEMMFTVVLVGLLGIVVATGINVASRTYAKVRDVADVNSVLNIAANIVSDELRYAGSVTYTDEIAGDGIPIEGNYAFDSANKDARIMLVNTKNDENVGSIGAVLAYSTDSLGDDDDPFTGFSLPSSFSASGSQSKGMSGLGEKSASSESTFSILQNIKGMKITVQISDIGYSRSQNLWTVEITAYKNAKWEGGNITSWAYEASTGPLKIRALNDR